MSGAVAAFAIANFNVSIQNIVSIETLSTKDFNEIDFWPAQTHREKQRLAQTSSSK